jgi:hypothetical protein
VLTTTSWCFQWLAIFWDVMPRSLVNRHQRFAWTFCLHFQIRRANWMLENTQIRGWKTVVWIVSESMGVAGNNEEGREKPGSGARKRLTLLPWRWSVSRIFLQNVSKCLPNYTASYPRSQ